MNQGSTKQLRFRGAPNHLSAVVRLSGDERAMLSQTQPALVNMAGAEAQPLSIRPIGDADTGISLLKLRLPKTTPPGTYEGTVEAGGRQLPVVIEVEPVPRLRIIPQGVVLQTSANARITSDLDVINTGNVPIDIEREHAFCVFDESGLEHAFYVALAKDSIKGERRLERLMDKLAEAHGGLLRVIVEDGAGEIVAGDMRNMRITLIMPGRLSAGHAYSGTWSPFGYHIRIETDGRTRYTKEAK